jgi:hypothetical protein
MRGTGRRARSTFLGNPWFPGSAWEPMSRGSASIAEENWRQSLRICVTRQLEAEPPDLRYQALPGNKWIC